MQSINAPSQEHAQFDAMCDGLEDFEPLPELTGHLPHEVLHAETRGQEDEALDGQIMAGLVSPL
jgi:hypothetical protein